VFGAELVVGYVVAWVVRKVRRVAGAADEVVDQALDAGVERVHDLVAERLRGQRALAAVEEEAAAGGGEVLVRSRQFLQLAIEDAAAGDAAFAAALDEAVAAVQVAAGQAPGVARAVYGNVLNGPTSFQVGDHNTQTNTFGS
jgi:hypothetical protein